MKSIILCLAVIMLSGCSTIQGWIPSFWDANQSARITDIQLRIHEINCAQPQLAQAQRLLSTITWLELYSTSKGTRQQDVLVMIKPLRASVEDWVKRSEHTQGTVAYCEIKRRLLESQARTAARAIQGRF